MSKPRKVYQVGKKAFILKKNAEAERKQTNEDLQTVNLGAEQFFLNLEECLFSDMDEFLKKNPNFLKERESKTEMVIEKTEIVPAPKEKTESEKIEDSYFEDVPDIEEESTEELSELRQVIFNLSARLDSLQAENEELKNKEPEPKELSFEEAAQLYKEKAKKLDYLAIFENTKHKIESIERFTEDEDSPTDTKGYQLKVVSKDYRETVLFSTSNILVINEAVNVVKESIIRKIDELKTEIQTLNV